MAAVLEFLTDRQSLAPMRTLDAAVGIVRPRNFKHYLGHVPAHTWRCVWTEVITTEDRRNPIGMMVHRLRAGERGEESLPFGHPSTLVTDPNPKLSVIRRREAVQAALAALRSGSEPVQAAENAQVQRSRASQGAFDRLTQFFRGKGGAS